MVFPWYVLPPHQLPSARTKPHALGGSYADGLRERNGDSGGNLYGEGVNGQLTWTSRDRCCHPPPTGLVFRSLARLSFLTRVGGTIPRQRPSRGFQMSRSLTLRFRFGHPGLVRAAPYCRLGICATEGFSASWCGGFGTATGLVSALRSLASNENSTNGSLKAAPEAHEAPFRRSERHDFPRASLDAPSCLCQYRHVPTDEEPHVACRFPFQREVISGRRPGRHWLCIVRCAAGRTECEGQATAWSWRPGDGDCSP